ncbi:hypothetical protein GCM10023187_42150 [Nibrella viscosa]|uniref:Uncharacterized protein n=1 Tax=Nibrella viscosa TaxID=1084524 RepID=A0ABP8KSN1_9BACT
MFEEGPKLFNDEFVYRELFSEDEARSFARPERQVPTTFVAYASVVTSFIFALVLFFFHRQEREKKTSSPVRPSDSLMRLQEKPVKPNQPSVSLYQ